MKVLIVITILIAIMARSSLETSPLKDLNKLLQDVKDLKIQNPELKNETEFKLNQIEAATDLKPNDEALNLVRRKREVPLINCTALQMQLNSTKIQINATQVKIQNATNSLALFNKSLAFYEQKLLSPTLTDTQRNSSHTFVNSLTIVINSTTKTLQTNQQNLSTLQGTETKLKAYIEEFCSSTTLSPSTAACVCPTIAATTTPSTTTLASILSIPPGSFLTTNRFLSSTEGCTLKFSGGDLVLNDVDVNVIWRAGISDGVTLYNFDGTASILDASGKLVWSIKGPAGSELLIQNCELVLTDGETIIWSSSNGYFSTSTTMPSTTQLPCGTFFYYNPRTDINGPAVRGVSAGTFIDGSQAYVGLMTGCSGQAPMPARIDVTLGKAGAYMFCGSSMSFDSYSASYLVNDNRYQWIPTNSTDMFQYNTTAIILRALSNKFMIGRITKGNYTTIAKVYLGGSFIGAKYEDPFIKQEVAISTGYEILTSKC